MHNFLTILWKEFIHIRRDSRTVTLVFIFPLLMIILYGYAISFELKQIPTGVVDFDKSAEVSNMLLSLSASRYFKITPYPSVRKMYDGLMRGNIKCGFVIPEDFSKNLSSERFSKIQLLIDGSDANLGKRILQINQRYFTHSSLNVRFLYNSELKSRNFFVPGLIVILMTMLGVILSARSIVGEKERGNFELLSTTPVSGKVIILGKLIPYGIIALLDVFIITGASLLIFQIPFRGSLLSLFFHSLLFLFPTLALGLMISAYATTELTAVTTSFIATMLPSIILSGFIFPVCNMPGWLQWVSNIIPATHFLQIVRGIFLKGVGIFPRESLSLLALGVTYLLISIRGVKKRIR